MRSRLENEGAPEPVRANAVGRRTADAGNRPCADDAAENPHPRRADAGPGAGHPRTIVEGAGEAAANHADHGAARRAERDLRLAPRRPRLRAGARTHRPGRRSRPLRRGSRRRLPLRTIWRGAGPLQLAPTVLISPAGWASCVGMTGTSGPTNSACTVSEIHSPACGEAITRVANIRRRTPRAARTAMPPAQTNPSPPR